MKRIAALYDIHGNLPALEAVLDEVKCAQVEQIVVGGDIVPGPMPRETLERLQQLDVPVQFIRGNGELAVLGDLRGVPEQFRDAIRWSSEQLSRDQIDWLSEWPRTCSVSMDQPGDVLFCHATPADENEIFTRLTRDERVLELFARVEAPLVICGHTHMQFDRRVGNIRIVNSGSAGMAFGEPAPAGC